MDPTFRFTIVTAGQRAGRTRALRRWLHEQGLDDPKRPVAEAIIDREAMTVTLHTYVRRLATSDELARGHGPYRFEVDHTRGRLCMAEDVHPITALPDWAAIEAEVNARPRETLQRRGHMQ